MVKMVRGKMLNLIGIGLNDRQLTLEALDAIKKSSAVFVEAYTSRYASGTIQSLEKKLKKKIKFLDRAGVEENLTEVILLAKKKNVSLLVVGNSLFATTHDGVLNACREKKVKCNVIPGIGIVDYLGLSGLSPYKFGRVVTIVSPKPNFSPESFFDQLVENQKLGLHTLCLLDLDVMKNKFMTIAQAIEVLQSIAKKRSVTIDAWAGIALVGLGNSKSQIVAGSLLTLAKKNFKLVPQSLIIVGNMNSIEQSNVEAWHGQKK